VVVVERFARELAMFAGPGGGLSGEVGVGGCEMTHADELKPADPAFGVDLGDLTLRLVAVGEQLLADVVDAGLAQISESDGVVAGLGQAVAAVAEGVRARR
jgi:hypothetical protein